MTRKSDISPQDFQPPAGLNRPMQRAALSDQQQILVKENIGLVYVHLKNYVTPHRIPWTRREWEDLVQEGCLGLIRAAQDFNPQGHIPFAAFALPRIHTAVRRCMLKRFGASVAFAGGKSPARRSLFGLSTKPDWSPRQRRRLACDDDPLTALGDWWGANSDTLGVRMREKYERAVHRAVARLLAESPPGEAHEELIRALAAERHLVPDVHARKPYRHIARRINAPYTRVIQFDRHLHEAIKGTLDRDPEFAELQRLARAEPRGVDTPVDESFDQRLARLSAAELLQRLLHSPGERREKLVEKLFFLATDTFFQALRTELESLPVSAREDLLHESSPVLLADEGPQNTVPGDTIDAPAPQNVSSASPDPAAVAPAGFNLVASAVSG